MATSELMKLEGVRTDLLNDECEPFPLRVNNHISTGDHLHHSLNTGYYEERTS